MLLILLKRSILHPSVLRFCIVEPYVPLRDATKRERLRFRSISDIAAFVTYRDGNCNYFLSRYCKVIVKLYHSYNSSLSQRNVISLIILYERGNLLQSPAARNQARSSLPSGVRHSGSSYRVS
jgi:hypothetical protein